MGTKIIETGSTAGGIAKVEYKDELGNVLWYYDDAGNFVRNGNVKAGSFSVSSLNAAPASATATGTAGEVRVTTNGVYYCTTTNTWRKALHVHVLTETITGLTSTFKDSTLPGVNNLTKYLWSITSGTNGGVIESTHNTYAGNNTFSLVTGATVQTVTANSVYSVRIGNSVLEIKFDTGTGLVSYRIASGTITEITVSRLTHGAGWL